MQFIQTMIQSKECFARQPSYTRHIFTFRRAFARLTFLVAFRNLLPKKIVRKFSIVNTQQICQSFRFSKIERSQIINFLVYGWLGYTQCYCHIFLRKFKLSHLSFNFIRIDHYFHSFLDFRCSKLSFRCIMQL